MMSATEDATRRTRLANERTYLAWWRTGLTAMAVCVGVGYGVLGAAFVGGAYLRTRKIECALDAGGFAPLTDALLLGLSLAGVLLAAATILVMLTVN